MKSMHPYNYIRHLSKLTSLGVWLIVFGITMLSCEEPENPISKEDTVNADTNNKPSGFVQYSDTYHALAPIEYMNQWGPYNLHDPSVISAGDYHYSYSTDVAFGAVAPAGIQVRRSRDLIHWEFVGRAFDGLPKQGADFIRQHGGEPFNALWAPYMMKVGNEYRLYYSLSSPTPRLSVIGLATSTKPTGPWEEKGLIVTSLDDNILQTNAIDPAVVVDKAGTHWFYYGSAWDGIYVLKLDAATGLAAVEGDKGKRVAQRGFTGGSINGNIEGPEVIYHKELDKYYMFVAYDWLETKYNVRVGRADNPEGPFYDFHGKDLNGYEDNTPMILAPYQFNNHSGWQGTSHCAVFEQGDQYYMAHQGRPGENKYFMVMHVREMYWTEDGWPVVSPERYAGEKKNAIQPEELIGSWEQIVLGYQVAPGYANEQVSPDFQRAMPLELNAGGSINGDANNHWEYDPPWLTLHWGDVWLDKVYVERGRDWENQVDETILFTGLNNGGTAIWGKKMTR